ncbi:MAG: dihydroneopterin aldolase [Nitrospirota bacterium]|jgi:dihydroneopterin aldolase
MNDLIQIHDLAVDCIVGIHEWERQHPQRVFLDIEMSYDIRPSAATDDFSLTVDYDRASQLIEALIIDGKYELIETMAERTAALMFAEFPITAVRIRVRKPQALNKAAYAGVEIVRERGV